DRIDNLYQQPDALVEATAVAVGAEVGQRRQELVQQVAVGGVDLEHLEAGVERAAGGGREVLDDLFDPGRIQRLGHRGAFIEGDRRDRKSTRLNSSHVKISYAVFCLKKKRKKHQAIIE